MTLLTAMTPWISSLTEVQVVMGDWQHHYEVRPHGRLGCESQATFLARSGSRRLRLGSPIAPLGMVKQSGRQ